MIEALSSETAFAHLVAGSLENDRFTLLDIGCSGGIDKGWRAFGNHLRAFAFDPNVAEVRRLVREETNTNVEYIPQFVGLAPNDEGIAQLRGGPFWADSPWERFSVVRTEKIRSAKHARDNEGNSRPEVADKSNPVVIPDFLRQRGIRDVDFVKIDIDGPDFLILRSLKPTLAETNVLGVAAEVNFFGSAEPNIHTFHNVDRLLRECGFDLFLLSTRPYSVSALPAPYQYQVPAHTLWGRIAQGDAIYFKDAAAPHNAAWAAAVGRFKLLKLAALFSLTGLPDCAAEILLGFRSIIEPALDVNAGLNVLTQQSTKTRERALSYAQYMAEFEADGDRFYPSKSGNAARRANKRARNGWFRFGR